MKTTKTVRLTLYRPTCTLHKTRSCLNFSPLFLCNTVFARRRAVQIRSSKENIFDEIFKNCVFYIGICNSPKYKIPLRNNRKNEATKKMGYKIAQIHIRFNRKNNFKFNCFLFNQFNIIIQDF